ncbi:hypothetical protein [Prosthecobacter vanneervenii]|uniref:Orc1-like AAA ATPase domain-containing protein n=1 Tax=Prosthecobacter vanneervenii TaxID=48466 RepID=A0A7W7YD45_9BACT|nr:hypothetical protein [Prosthecobacter vanneervenii]MBB5033959.1 hypothetical protein [Prosthecobacter vanneervenii]
MSPYAALNPFTSTSVGENDLWNAAAFVDVPYIHSVPFGALRVVVDQVRAQHRSQVRFVRGAGGSGKSHLFSRLRHECADSIFYAYAPNPPLQPEALENFILSRFVSSLRHPARSKEGKETPYSQLRLLAYALLKPVVEQDFTFPQLHDAWAEISLETRKEMIHQAVQLLEAEHPMVPRSVLRCLLNILRDDKEHLAAQWLSGAAYLTEAELKYLGVVEPLARSEMGIVIQLFGKLASQAGAPVVLVLDQLDLVITQPQLDEMQRLLFALIDQSQNWVVLIGLVAERYAAWDASLTQALRGRVGVPDTNAPLGFRLPVIDMLPIANEQKRLLLNCRLDSPALAAQRQKDGITSAIHPLQEEDIARLTAGGAIFPRHLLAAAAELYAMRTSSSALPPEIVAAVSAQPVVPPPMPPPVPQQVIPVQVPVPAAVAVPVAAIPLDEVKPAAVASAIPAPSVAQPPPPPSGLAVPSLPRQSLAEKVDSLFQEAVTAAKSEADAPSAIDLGERTRDLIQLMVAPPVTISEGDIRKTYDNFDGSDRWFEWGGSKVRVVTSNSMRGSFIAVLERLKESAGDTLLLRNDIAPVSGQLTMELLNAFKAKNTFHHIPASEAAVLSALGRMLAAQREGSYDQLATEPPASRDNVLAALRGHPLLRGLRLWDMIQKAHAPKAAPPGPPPTSVLSSIIRQPASVAAVAPVPQPPPMPAVTPPAFPVAKPAPPPMPAGVVKPVAKPPGMPMAKPVAKPPAPPVAKPPAAVARPPMAKLPPPSQGTAA